jgi:hypothetical protein
MSGRWRSGSGDRLSNLRRLQPNHEVRKKNNRRHDGVVEPREQGGRCSNTGERNGGEIEAEGDAEEKAGVELGRCARSQYLRPTAKRFSCVPSMFDSLGVQVPYTT